MLKHMHGHELTTEALKVNLNSGSILIQFNELDVAGDSSCVEGHHSCPACKYMRKSLVVVRHR